MPYIFRDDDGNITGFSKFRATPEQEKIAPESDEWNDYLDSVTAKKDAEAQRIVDIESEKESSGLKNITVSEAHAKIDQIFADKTTVAQLRTACIKAFKILVAFVIK